VASKITLDINWRRDTKDTVPRHPRSAFPYKPTISTSCASLPLQRKQIRHRSLIRMLCCPARLPRSFSSRFPGGTPQVRERHSRIQLAELAKRGAFDV
jgi:hypothetical protein